MASLVDIYNMALDIAGHRSRISSTTEKDVGAEACSLWYPVMRDHVLKAARWSVARGSARLALRATKAEGDWVSTDPEPGWQFAYGVPTDFLYPRYSSTYARFEMGSRAGAQVIFSNEEQTILTYTKRIENAEMFDPDLVLAVANALGAVVTMPLSGKPQRASDAVAQANSIIMAARQNSANEDAAPLQFMPSWLAARGVSAPALIDTYIYPVGPLLNV